MIGRTTGEIKDIVENGDVVIQFANDTTCRLTAEEIVGDKTGHVLTVTWEAPKTVRLEDCVNLGKGTYLGLV